MGHIKGHQDRIAIVATNFMPQFVDLGDIDGLYLVLLMEQASSTLQDVIISKESYEDAMAMNHVEATALILNAVSLTPQDVKPANFGLIETIVLC